MLQGLVWVERQAGCVYCYKDTKSIVFIYCPKIREWKFLTFRGNGKKSSCSDFAVVWIFPVLKCLKLWLINTQKQLTNYRPFIKNNNQVLTDRMFHNFITDIRWNSRNNLLRVTKQKHSWISWQNQRPCHFKTKTMT